MAKYSDEEQKLRDSLVGSTYDKQYFTTDELQSADAIVKSASEGKTDWKSAHDYVEGLRSGYGYSGGSDGSQYIKTGYSQLPTYVSQTQQAIDDALNAYLNRESFTYDYTTDPRWQAYKKEYTREGQRATADALGQYSAATGGMPSTAAMTAATQAGDYYSAQMADKIPELYDLAYSMYQQEGNDMLNRINLLRNVDDTNYNRYMDAQNFNYQAGRDAVSDSRYDQEFQYQQDRDAISDSRYDTEWNYQVQQDQYDNDLAKAQLLAQYGDFSGFEAMGYSPEQIAQMKSAYASSLKSSKSSSKSTTNEWYDKALKKAESYSNPKDAMSYLENLVNSGKITPDEAVDIYYYELGYDDPDVEMLKYAKSFNGSQGNGGGTSNNITRNLKATR